MGKPNAERRRHRAWSVLLLFALAPSPAAASALDAPDREAPDQRADALGRGRMIYRTGSSPSGNPIVAVFGVEEIELPGEAAACGSCHGYDGEGYAESGIDPANITWPYLTKSYGHVHGGGVHHPAYTRELLARYIRAGEFPGGERGDPAMPRYRISDADMDDLLVYLERLGAERSPGVTADTITIGTIVPAGGSLAAAGETIKSVLRASFEAVNTKGGIYGRRLELSVVDTTTADGNPLGRAGSALATADVLALAATLTPTHDRDLAEVTARLDVPLVGPFNLYSATSYEARRQVFYLQPGLSGQLASLVAFAAESLQFSSRKLVILYPEQPDSRSLVAGLQSRAHAAGFDASVVSYRPRELDAQALVSTLRTSTTEIVLTIMVEPELRALMEEVSRQSWRPYILAAGVLSGRAPQVAPEEIRERLYLAYPSLPLDRKPAALEALAELVEDGQIDGKHLQPAITALVASNLLLEAIRRSGRDLNRRRLVEKLETLYRFDTGLTPPLTFTSTRRTGAAGAYVLGGAASSGRKTPEAVWVELK